MTVCTESSSNQESCERIRFAYHPLDNAPCDMLQDDTLHVFVSKFSMLL